MPVILAAPGTGKSYWVRNHPIWTDADEWAAAQGLHTAEWHASRHTEQQTIEHYRRIDAELEKLPRNTYLIGSLYWDFVPDAIVLIDPRTHRSRVERREDLKWDSVSKVVGDLEKKASDNKVPVFDSFDAASKYIEKMVHKEDKSKRGAFHDAADLTFFSSDPH